VLCMKRLQKQDSLCNQTVDSFFVGYKMHGDLPYEMLRAYIFNPERVVSHIYKGRLTSDGLTYIQGT
jgi:hypothetical protein